MASSKLAFQERRVGLQGARPADGVTALREQLVALATLGGAILAATISAKARHELTRLNRFALDEGVGYFRERAKDIRDDRPLSDLTSMAAMTAVTNVIPMEQSKERASSTEIARFLDRLAANLEGLAKNPGDESLAASLEKTFDRLGDRAWAEARRLADQEAARSVQA